MQSALDLYNQHTGGRLAPADAALLPKAVQPLHRQWEQGRIEVRNNGVGISNQVRQRIFQPFFTTKHLVEGNGLGLPLSLGIIDKGPGGTLAVRTAKGIGTEVIIRLLQA
jgi:C4-dicarboxylate-specific signal transduction histidine kinase